MNLEKAVNHSGHSGKQRFTSPCQVTQKVSRHKPKKSGPFAVPAVFAVVELSFSP